jgi:hypothetical protein
VVRQVSSLRPMSEWDERDPKFLMGDVDDKAEAERDVEFYVTHENPGTVRGVWRNKKMRADRHPMYVKPHDERHLWLSPGIRRRRRSRSVEIQEIMEIEAK